MSLLKINQAREKPESFDLSWFDPLNKKQFPAGMAFYYANTNDYVLRIDEEPLEKHYTLSSKCQLNNKVYYDVRQIIQNKQGRSIRKSTVGYGIFDPAIDRYIHINYGSKFKTLLLDTGERMRVCNLA